MPIEALETVPLNHLQWRNCEIVRPRYDKQHCMSALSSLDGRSFALLNGQAIKQPIRALTIRRERLIDKPLTDQSAITCDDVKVVKFSWHPIGWDCNWSSRNWTRDLAHLGCITKCSSDAFVVCLCVLVCGKSAASNFFFRVFARKYFAASRFHKFSCFCEVFFSVG